MEAYIITVGTFDPEFPDCYFSEEWSSWSPHDWEEANFIFDQIVENKVDPDHPNEEKWINEKDQFVYYWLLSSKPSFVDLPIRVCIEFKPQKPIYCEDKLKAWSKFSGLPRFCVIKEAIVYPVKHYVLEDQSLCL